MRPVDAWESIEGQARAPWGPSETDRRLDRADDSAWSAEYDDAFAREERTARADAYAAWLDRLEQHWQQVGSGGGLEAEQTAIDGLRAATALHDACSGARKRTERTWTRETVDLKVVMGVWRRRREGIHVSQHGGRA